MFNPTAVVIDAFVNELRNGYTSTYTHLEPDYPGIIDYVGHMALELIANSDAPYHDLGHTICVTLLGQEVLKGRHLRQGGVSPRDWLHFIISLLCHDIGYVRGICRNDKDGHYVTGKGAETVELPEGATDASLTPYHIDRGMLFVRERFAKNRHIDVEMLCANIEYTRFPVPAENEAKAATDYPELLRASDLMGQLGVAQGRLSEILLVGGDALYRRRTQQPPDDAGGQAVGGQPLLARLRRGAQAADARRRTPAGLIRCPGRAQ
jgi:hypothetical protein